jgi:hypothetical protein
VAKQNFHILSEEGNSLAKMAAHYKIKALENTHQKSTDVSVKYQVLAKSTAFVGVVKNIKTKEAISSLELKQVTINDVFEK